MDKPIRLDQRCLVFSAEILKLIWGLPRNPSIRPIADQLLRSGTSIGANVHEARSAESRADFIHKMQIALKEAREVGYWLALINTAGLFQNAVLPSLCQECSELTAILVASIKTARRNSPT